MSLSKVAEKTSGSVSNFFQPATGVVLQKIIDDLGAIFFEDLFQRVIYDFSEVTVQAFPFFNHIKSIGHFG
jgi:hypothetical protein